MIMNQIQETLKFSFILRIILLTAKHLTCQSKKKILGIGGSSVLTALIIIHVLDSKTTLLCSCDDKL